MVGVAGEIGAGDGNRTHVCSLGSCRSTIELHPRFGACTIPPEFSPSASLVLGAFVALAGPLDLLARFAGRSEPIELHPRFGACTIPPEFSPSASLVLGAFVARNGPLDHFVRLSPNRSEPIELHPRFGACTIPPEFSPSIVPRNSSKIWASALDPSPR